MDAKFQKDRLTLALVVNTTCTNKLKLVILYRSLHPRCFGRWLPTEYVWWFSNRTTWMTSNVFESWMMSLHVHFKSQKRKVLLNMDNFATHFLKHVDKGESFGFSTLLLSNMTIAWLPPNITSAEQPLDQGINALFKVQNKKFLKMGSLLVWFSITQLELRIIMPNVRHSIMWCSQVLREMNPSIKQNN